jgi:Predicted oxidoreductases (related to aryl-alcohol dehydrogenases)
MDKGLSEEIIAEALQQIPRDKVQILTKYGLRWDRKEGSSGLVVKRWMEVILTCIDCRRQKI